VVSGGSGGTWDLNNNYGRDGIEPNEQIGGFRCVINSGKPLSQLEEEALLHLKKLS